MAITKMIKNATSAELVEALTGHLEETHKHVSRVEEVFKILDKKAVAKKKPEEEQAVTPVEVKATEPAKVEKPAVVAPKVDIPQPEAQKPAETEDAKPEHIEMKAPQLAGPKIIGRIELKLISLRLVGCVVPPREHVGRAADAVA